ncbi:MAG TPA: O-antigen ligase family protein [Leptolyngbyaceae cyanobacterium]
MPEILFIGCLAVLPFVVYCALAGILWLTVWSVGHHSSAIWQILKRNGWVILAGGMVVSAIMADFPGEAALQLTNFLPFFVFFSAVTVFLNRLNHPIKALEQWAFVLLIGTIPVDLAAGIEYFLRSPLVFAKFQNLSYLTWLYQEVNYGHRASSAFGHPNALAAYLAIVFGLGLGLILKELSQNRVPGNELGRCRLLWLYGATALALGGTFCSGSRNGILVAIAQLLVFAWLMRRNRFVTFLGIASITTVVAGVLTWGIGGRSVSEAVSTSTLRVEVWRLALKLIEQNPWLGTGLGGFRLHYVPYSIPEYDLVEHAHNLWLMLAAEIGIPLMLLFTTIVGLACYRGVRSLMSSALNKADRSILIGYLLGFMGCTLFALFDVTFYDARVNVLGWLTLAAIQSIPQLRERANLPEPKST